MIMPPLPTFPNKPPSDDEEVTDNFDTGFDNDLLAMLDNFVRVVSVLLAEYGVASPLQYFDDDYFEDIKEHIVEIKEWPKPITTKLFEKPIEEMRTHLRPLHMKAIVKGQKVGKILVDRGATTNFLVPKILDKLGKAREKLRTTNIVVTNYRGKLTPA